jgi:hypothetical protein
MEVNMESKKMSYIVAQPNWYVVQFDPDPSGLSVNISPIVAWAIRQHEDIHGVITHTMDPLTMDGDPEIYDAIKTPDGEYQVGSWGFYRTPEEAWTAMVKNGLITGARLMAAPHTL